MPQLSLQDIDAAIDREMASPQVPSAAHPAHLQIHVPVWGCDYVGACSVAMAAETHAICQRTVTLADDADCSHGRLSRPGAQRDQHFQCCMLLFVCQEVLRECP